MNQGYNDIQSLSWFPSSGLGTALSAKLLLGENQVIFFGGAAYQDAPKQSFI